MRNKNLLLLIFGLILFGVMLGSSNYQFQLEVTPKGTWVDIPTEQYYTAASDSQYIDATQTTSYGTITNGPPNGMGNSDLGPTDDTELLEASYSAGSWSAFDDENFESWPDSGWNQYHFYRYATGGQSGAYIKSGSGVSYAYFTTPTVSTAGYTDTRISFYYKQTDLEASDFYIQVWDRTLQTIWQCPAGSKTSWTSVSQVTGHANSGWYSRWYISYGTSGESCSIDTIVLEGYTSATYYRFDAVFRFDSVNYGYANYFLYVDFYTALTGSDDLDMFIESDDTTPDIFKCAEDKQNDFNIDVTPYITSDTVYLRIYDDYRTGDTVQTTAYIQRIYLYTSNTPPVNDQAPTLDNPTESTYMYAHYTKYQITAYASDADGFADIDYLEIGLWDDTQTTEYWRGRYDEDTDTFTEEYDGGTYVELDAVSSSASKFLNDIDATFYITVDWDFPDVLDIDTKCYVIDVATATDTDWYEVSWKVETRTDFSSFSLSDGAGTVDRGNYDSIDSITASGTVIYFGGSTNPPSGKVDVWVSCSDIAGSPWSDLDLSAGVFSMTVDSDDVVGLDTYTFKTVIEGTGSGGTDLSHETHTDTYIADRVQVNKYTTDDARININTASSCHITVIYDYDNSYVTDGFIYVNGLTAIYSGSLGVWNFGETKTTTTGITYDNMVATANTHGITVEDQNETMLLQVWDQLKLTMTSNYYWTIINHNVTLSATGVYDYDSWIWTGVITWTDRYPTESVIGSYDYGDAQITSITDPTYGLTSFYVYSMATVVFDNITIPTEPNKYWVQYSPKSVWLIWGAPCSFENVYDSSPVMDGILIQSQINGTDNARSSTYGGSIYGLSIGSFDTSWYYANITIIAEFTAGGYNHNIRLWSKILVVDILHSIHVTEFDFDIDDYYINVIGLTEWGNATLTVFMNESTVVAYSSTEGTFSFERPTTPGLYTYTVLFNTTHSGSSYDSQVCDYSLNDHWVFFIRPYRVAEAITTTGDLAISYRATNGKPISFLEVNSTITYNGNTIILSDNVLYSVPTNANFTLEVRNIWGALIHNSTFAYASHKWIMLNMVEFVLDNQADHMVRVDLSYNGTYSNITYMVPANNPRILDVYTGVYLVTFTYYTLSVGVGELVDYYLTTGYYVSYTINITGPGGLMYSGIGLLDIQHNINANTDEEADETQDFITDVKNNLPGTPEPFIAWDTMIVVLFAFAVVLFIVWGLRALFRDRREGKVAQDSQTDPLEEPIQYD